MYLVVEFTDRHETALIPSTWLDGTSCAVWPPFKNTTKITNAAKEKALPGTDWKAYPIKELYKNGEYIFTLSNTLKFINAHLIFFNKTTIF